MDEDVVNELIRSAYPAQVITNYVFVAEVTSGTGQELHLEASDGMTPWLLEGMLRGALALAPKADQIDDDEDQDDDER